MTVIEGNDTEITTSDDNSPAARVLVDAWREVAQAQRDALYGITFGDLVARIKQAARTCSTSKAAGSRDPPGCRLRDSHPRIS